MMTTKNEFHGPKRKRFLLWLSGITLVGLGAVLAYQGYMNYQGYCWEDRSYLSDQEKIHRAVQDVLAQYPPDIIPMKRCETNCEVTKAVRIIPVEELKLDNSWGLTPPGHPIAYKGLDDFFSENPNCCELRQDQQFDPRSPEFGVPSFWDRVTGKEVNYIRIRYWVKYLQSGTEKRLQQSYYAGLSTCAKHTSKATIPRFYEQLIEKSRTTVSPVSQ